MTTNGKSNLKNSTPAPWLRMLPKPLVLGLVLSVFFISSLAGYFLWQSRQMLLQKAANNAESLTSVLERYAYSALHESDVFLSDTAADYRNAQAGSDHDPGRFIKSVIAEQEHHPLILNVLLADAKGNIVFDGMGARLAQPINISDRTYFSEARDNDRFVISEPVVGSISHEWVIPVARRLQDADGRFAGVVVANMRAKDFTDLFASLKAGPKNTYLFFDPGTNINLRYPEPKGPGSAIGLKIGSPQFKDLWWKQGIHAATYRARSTTDGIWRTYSYRQIGDYPYYVMAGVAEEDTLTPWRLQLAVASGFIGVFLFLAGYLLWSQGRDIAERRRLEAERETTWQMLESMIENIPNMIFMKRASDLRFVMFNKAGEELLGHHRSELLGKNDYDFFPQEQADFFTRKDREVLASTGVVDIPEESIDTLHHGRRILHTKKLALFDKAGKAEYLLGISEDITERKEAEALGQLRTLLADMVYSHDLQQLLETALDTAQHLTDSPTGFFLFIEKDQETVSQQILSGRSNQERDSAKGEGPPYPGTWLDCIRQGRPLIRNDRIPPPQGRGLSEGQAASGRVLTVPVLRDKRVVAVVGVGDKPGDYDEHDLALVARLADMAYDFVERRKTEEKIQFMAFNDVLTGLPNRQLFADRLRQAIALSRRSNKLLAIGYLDLDGFKPVNDRYGHEVGDQLLVQLAHRLQQELREGDSLGRLGGDEFVILLNELGSIFNGEQIVGRLLQIIAQPYDLDGHRVHISASIGVTFFPHDDVDPDTLIRHADQAMYKAKESGKNAFSLYDPIQDLKVRAFRKDIDEFELALQQKQLVLHYQPRIDLRTGELAGVEALVRWQHPEKGLLYPGKFLPLIEDSPLETALDEWVLQTALEQHLTWRTNGLTVPVSVNISPRHIQQADFPTFLGKLLSAHPEGLSRYLELEVLETSAIGDTAHVAEIMNACARFGVAFSLDDFGTGYSSLTYFHRLPIHVLKIDQHFVRDMLSDSRDQDIVEGVLRLADALDRPVVAEGVETIEIGLMLADLGCQYAQGYGIARPMPAEALPQWSTQWQGEQAWHRLPLETPGLTSRYDLNVAIFTLTRWLEAIRTYLESGLTAERPELDETTCQFSRWYRGIGAVRYGKRPTFPLLPAKHDEVHRIARELVETAESRGTNAALAGLGRLTAACEGLITLLSQLSGE